jgi:type IV pilus modification protein PilV
MKTKQQPRRRARHPNQLGMSLLEALVALVVMAFGMLALAGMQLNLSRSADVAKQRTEAMRLAHERLENMRSFTDISTGTINWNGLDGLTRTFATTNTNAAYAIDSSMSGADADAMRAASVTVRWLDRAGDNAQVNGLAADGATAFSFNQQVSLDTVISRTDPRDPGFVGNPLPLNTVLRRPKNRNINIPIAAIALPGGRSAYELSPGVTIVFSDLSGSVIERCTATVDATSYANGTAGCAVFDAYILAGYVSGEITPTGTPLPAASAPYFPVPTLPTGINTSGLTGWDSSGGKVISCIYTRAIDQSDLSPPPTATATLAHYYLCLIPVTPGGTYSGTVRLGGVATNSNRKVCRFQYAASSSLTPNMRNIQPYVSVGESLDSQNYYIENSNNNNCPTISSSGGTTTNGGSVATTLHQNCRSSTSPTTTATGTCPLSAYNTVP